MVFLSIIIYHPKHTLASPFYFPLNYTMESAIASSVHNWTRLVWFGFVGV